MPNLVPKEKLERANQLSLVTTYGSAPLAAGLFSVMALIIHGLSLVTPFFHTHNNNTSAYLALYFNATSYFVSAIPVYVLPEFSNRRERVEISVPSTAKAVWQGWRFIAQTPVGGGR